ncbi:hypothetical protein QL285_043694 [Trifolium repens]|nr:hypothetical protein QL285_043694 [Trifolium repens]
MEFNSKKQGGFRVGWLNQYLETALHINGFVNFHREMNSGRIFEVKCLTQEFQKNRVWTGLQSKGFIILGSIMSPV